MPSEVHILCTCRNPALWRASTLVFDTLRVGFPNARVFVYRNRLANHQIHELHERLYGQAVEFLDVDTVHHEWILRLLATRQDPLFICDTDVVFWDSMERWDFDGESMAGRFTPDYFEPLINARYHQRLHTAVMYLDPMRIQGGWRRYWRGVGHTHTPFKPAMPNLIWPMFHPMNGETWFYDTCALLYHAIGGRLFTEAQMDCFDHLNCGTYSDMASANSKILGDIGVTHKAIFADPQILKGAWRRQDDYYAALA